MVFWNNRWYGKIPYNMQQIRKKTVYLLSNQSFELMKEDIARFDTKMSTLHKSLIEEAARLMGFKNLSEYVITTVVANAKTVITEYKDTLYSVEDRKRIMDVLSEPTELSSSFLRASERRMEKILNDDSDRTT